MTHSADRDLYGSKEGLLIIMAGYGVKLGKKRCKAAPVKSRKMEK